MPGYNDFGKGAPTVVYGEGPQDYLFWDDFNDLNVSGTAGAGKWRFDETAAGSTALLNTASSSLGHGGVLAMSFSSPTDEDLISLWANGGVLPSSLLTSTNGPALRFGCRFNLADVSHNDFFIGLSIYDASIAASEPADLVGFYVVAADGDGQLDIKTQKNSTEQSSTGIATLADATWCRAFFEWWPTVGNTDSGILYYTVHHNGTVARNTVTIADTFPDSVLIAPVIQYQIEGTDSDTAYIDWVYAHGLRAAYAEGTG